MEFVPSNMALEDHQFMVYFPLKPPSTGIFHCHVGSLGIFRVVLVWLQLCSTVRSKEHADPAEFLQNLEWLVVPVMKPLQAGGDHSRDSQFSLCFRVSVLPDEIATEVIDLEPTV